VKTGLPKRRAALLGIQCLQYVCCNTKLLLATVNSQLLYFAYSVTYCCQDISGAKHIKLKCFAAQCGFCSTLPPYGTLYAIWDASLSCGVLVMMQKLYHVAGVEGKPVVFLLTDTQISKESFLEDVNNLLNSGEVPGMYAPEDKEGIIGSIREWLLTQGAPTTKVCLKPLLLL